MSIDVMASSAECSRFPAPQLASCRLFSSPCRNSHPPPPVCLNHSPPHEPLTGGAFVAAARRLSSPPMGRRPHLIQVGIEQSPRHEGEAITPLPRGGRRGGSPGHDRTARRVRCGADAQPGRNQRGVVCMVMVDVAGDADGGSRLAGDDDCGAGRFRSCESGRGDAADWEFGVCGKEEVELPAGSRAKGRRNRASGYECLFG